MNSLYKVLLTIASPLAIIDAVYVVEASSSLEAEKNARSRIPFSVHTYIETQAKLLLPKRSD